MNNFQKLKNQTVWVMRDVSYMILLDKYAVVGGYDYNEYSLFRYCKKKLNSIIKIYNFSKEDIINMRGSLYQSFTEPLCENIAKDYIEYSKCIRQ